MKRIVHYAMGLMLASTGQAPQTYLITSERLGAGGLHTVLGSLPNTWSSGLCSTRAKFIAAYPGGEKIELDGSDVLVFLDVPDKEACARRRSGDFFLAPPEHLSAVSSALGVLTRVDAKVAEAMCFALSPDPTFVESARLYRVAVDGGMVIGHYRLETSAGGIGLELSVDPTNTVWRSQAKCELLPG